jgi:hypothetical protein
MLVVFIILLALVVSAAVLYGYQQNIMAGQHAYDRRAEQSGAVAGAAKVNAVIDCLNKNGTMLRMFNPATNRKADICLIDGTADKGDFGVNITTQDGQPVTTILKEKLHCIDQVVRWLANTGYIVQTIH